MPQKQPRQSNFELLRILAMFAIIVFHYACWIQDRIDLQGGTVDYVLYWGMRPLGQLGNSLFVLISGYFMVKMEFRLRRVARMWAEMAFYSWFFTALRMLLGWRPSAESLYKLLLPALGGQYAFMSFFILLSLLAPFLNKLIHALDRSGLRRLNALLFVIFGVLDSVVPGGFASFTWLGTFIFLYCLAAYLRLYPDALAFCRRPGRCFAVAALIAAFQLVWIVLCGLFGGRFSFLRPDRFSDMRTAPQMLLALFLFLGFARLRVPHSRLINRVASAALGVYLLHFGGALRMPILDVVWGAFGDGGTAMMLPKVFALALATCVVCVPVDLLRQRFVEPLYMRLIDRLPPVRRELEAQKAAKI